MRAEDNPFASDRVHALAYRLRGESWQSLIARLEARSYRGAIVGPHGHGKTTLLEQLAEKLEAGGWTLHWLRLGRDERGKLIRPPRFPRQRLRARDVALVDGADLLPLWRWYALRLKTRSAGGLLITTHAPGWLPTLQTCRTSPALLRELVEELVQDRPGGELPFPMPGYAELHRRHAGNLRNALRELYDRCAELSSPKNGR